jgi:hypothetical protein
MSYNRPFRGSGVETLELFEWIIKGIFKLIRAGVLWAYRRIKS